ncbi:MAG: GatB/YqeY domain-containing protein [Pyrinomonadaceae bacterium]|nr:GatB/YqeY domain-containing protein [Pyrinomonadaceae bacterium]
MDLKQRITTDLTAAMKAKDAARLSTLRMVKASMTNREIEKGGELSDEELMKVMQSLVKQRRDSVEQYEKAGRQELADKELSEIKIIEEYLPQAASREEIEKAVESAIAETNAKTMRDMGAVMKAVQARLAGRSADGRTVSEVVKNQLGKISG